MNVVTAISSVTLTKVPPLSLIVIYGFCAVTVIEPLLPLSASTGPNTPAVYVAVMLNVVEFNTVLT